MTTEAEATYLRQAPPGAWPPDDTEESVVGTDLHQTTIVNLKWGITEAAELQRGAGGPPPWTALTQTLLLGCRRPDGSAYRTLPDIFVYRGAVDPERPSVSIELDGPPVLVVEALSASTYDIDLGVEGGKPYSYARAGVREYLALDPTRVYLPEGGRGWRLDVNRYESWKPDQQGRWQSEELPLAIGLDAVLATVYTWEGRRLLRMGEVERTIDELRRQLREASSG